MICCYGDRMNQPFRPQPPSGNEPPSYEADMHGWAMAQARLIRERLFDEIDWENVAEEIESVGRSERRSLRSHLTQLLLHMMKWDAQPERRGHSWIVSIENHRAEALSDLRDSPSVKAFLSETFADALSDARRRAALETNLPKATFASIDYTIEDAFNRVYERPDH